MKWNSDVGSGEQGGYGGGFRVRKESIHSSEGQRGGEGREAIQERGDVGTWGRGETGG